MKLTELTPEQKRIASAEACGYQIEIAYHLPFRAMIRKRDDEAYIMLPDYLNDLNAMHEAMRVLTDDIREVFSSHLRRIWAFNYNARCGSFPSHDDSRNATAAQRADAFLLATGRAEL